MGNKTYSPIYGAAFVDYLRYGTAVIEPYYLEDKIPAVYVWRTKGDDKVRTSHKENNGKIFTRDNPPYTGHPGTSYNCRCIAEPYIRGITGYANQTIINDISEARQKWSDLDFFLYSYTGGGREVTLTETGHLKGIINYYFYHLGIVERINKQIIAEALGQQRGGYFEYNFNNSYVFGGIEKYWNDGEQYMYCFGGSKIAGSFICYTINYGDIIRINGVIRYEFSDTFTDPATFRENAPWIATSELEEEDRGRRLFSDGYGIAYDIRDKWVTRFEAEVPITNADI